MVTLRMGQLVEAGEPVMDELPNEIGVCLHIDGEHYGLLFRGGSYDEFTQEQLAEFKIRPLKVVDEVAAKHTFVGVVDAMYCASRGKFLTFTSSVFPNGRPYAD